jgi:hypothetical protein
MEIEIIDMVTADSLGPGDQIIVDEDIVIVRTVDMDREDPDEVFITFENLSDPAGTDRLPLFADDLFPLWSY